MTAKPYCVRLEGWPIIVAGGASGIGKATVDRLTDEKAIVTIFDINHDAAKEVCEQFQSSGKQVTYQVVDVTDKQKCDSAVEKFANEHGGIIKGLVNSVAYSGSKGLDATRADWDKSFAVNVIGYSNMVQACYPYMKQAYSKTNLLSSIVNLASTVAHRAQPHRWTYSTTKGAVLSMTKCMALDLGKEVRVNSVSPAWIWSPQVAKVAVDGGLEKWGPIWGKFHIAGRIGKVEEVASTVAFLLSDDASFLTGIDIPIDGGYMAFGPERLGEDSKFAGSNYNFTCS